MTARSTRKGKAFERYVAKAFREVFPDARRGFQFRGGEETSDIVVPGYHVECKCGGHPNPISALEKASRECADEDVPIVVAKRDRGNITVTCYLGAFLHLLEIEKYGQMIDDRLEKQL